MNVTDAAAQLFDYMAVKGTAFTRHLLPGHSRTEIQALIEPSGIVLPEEALQFYEKYSLPKNYCYGPDAPTFFGIFWMVSLENAVEEAKWFTSEEYAEYEGSRGWLPFLQEEPNYYLLDTTHSVNGSCPIITLLKAGEPEPEYISMTAMFKTMYDWLSEGVLTIEDGHIMGDYEGDPLRVGEIAVRHNPGIVSWKLMATGKTPTWTGPIYSNVTQNAGRVKFRLH